jgi:hypothetical protein
MGDQPVSVNFYLTQRAYQVLGQLHEIRALVSHPRVAIELAPPVLHHHYFLSIVLALYIAVMRIGDA